ncbi:unnamed protein product [Somion occarium]|uniref:Uncharacterized protein n=1 Tax=Somion occarium TaxID=3059160 RepID=A0ABP1DS04_9APHY
MNATSTILYPTPPPTVNNLDAQQRARLVRSTRKLGAMLGATPQLIEVDARPKPIPVSFRSAGQSRPLTPKTKTHRRHGSIFEVFPETCPYSSSSSTNSSALSLTLPEPRSSVDVLPTPKSFSTNPRRSADAPRPLVLRLNAPTPTSDLASPDTATTIKFSHHTDGMLTPTPVTPVVPSAAELRRKKIAKLTRTLEPLPRKQRSMSVDESTGDDVFARTSRIWVTGTKAWQGAWNRKDIVEVQKQLRNLKAR